MRYFGLTWLLTFGAIFRLCLPVEMVPMIDFSAAKLIFNAMETVHDISSFFSLQMYKLCRVGLMVSVSASHTVGHEFASRPGHTKDHHKNGTDCLPVWHAMH